MNTAISPKEKSEICPDCHLIECKPLGSLCQVRKRRLDKKGKAYINPKIDRTLVLAHLEEIRAVARQRPNGQIYIHLPERRRFAELGLLGSPTTAGSSWWLVVTDRWLAEQLGELPPPRPRGGKQPSAAPAAGSPETTAATTRRDPRTASKPEAKEAGETDSEHAPSGTELIDGNHLDRSKVLANLAEIRAHARKWSDGKICIRLDEPARFAELGLMGSPLRSGGKGSRWWIASHSTWLSNVLGPIPPAQTRTSREKKDYFAVPPPALPLVEPSAESPAPAAVQLDPSFPVWHGTVQILHFANSLGMDLQRQLVALRLAVSAVEAEMGCFNA